MKIFNIPNCFVANISNAANNAFHRVALTIIACCCIFSVALAKPAKPGSINYTQPDGSTIQIRIFGDENSHYILDLDGNRMEANEEGWMLPATDSATRAASEFLPGERKYLFSGAAFPSVDSPKALVILVSFYDRFFSITNPKDYFSRMLNQEGFSDNGATGSAKDFFVENSSGLFTPQFDVYGPVKMSHAMSYYGNNDSYGYDLHPEEMVIEALTALDSTVDFSQYDNDGDGQIDNVYIYYAGYGEADSGIASTIWPHSADILDYELDQDYYFDGKLLNRYGMSNEVDYSTKKVDGIGTFVHEFSHVLGLPDLYATSYTGAFTPGTYSTLDYATYNNDGRTPANYSIFERYCLGWAAPRMIESVGYHTLAPLHLSNDGIIIPTEKNNEFFLLENRQQQGNDYYLPGHGMLVWHIEFNQLMWDDNVVNNLPKHQYVDLVEADNKLTSGTRGGDPFPGTSYVTSFTSKTTPALRSRAGKALYVTGLKEIKESGDGNISFYAEADLSAVDEIESAFGGNPIKSRNGELTNYGDDTFEIYNVAGVKISNLAPGASILLPSGVYIAVSPDTSFKLKN